MRTYGELKTALRSYLYERKDLEPAVPTFVQLSERRIFRLLRCPANEKAAVLELDNDRVRIPTDYLEAKVLHISGRQLERISDQQFLARRSSRQAAGTPAYFARLEDYLYVQPSPDTEAGLELVYWADFSGQMTADADTNEILRIAPDLYVYGAMIEAMPFLGQDSRTATWNSLFDQALAQINTQAIEAEYAGSTTRVTSAYSDSRGYPVGGI